MWGLIKQTFIFSKFYRPASEMRVPAWLGADEASLLGFQIAI